MNESDFEAMKVTIAIQHEQITLLIQAVDALKRATEIVTGDINDGSRNDPFNEVFEKLSELEFRQGITL